MHFCSFHSYPSQLSPARWGKPIWEECAVCLVAPLWGFLAWSCCAEDSLCPRPQPTVPSLGQAGEGDLAPSLCLSFGGRLAGASASRGVAFPTLLQGLCAPRPGHSWLRKCLWMPTCTYLLFNILDTWVWCIFLILGLDRQCWKGSWYSLSAVIF